MIQAGHSTNIFPPVSSALKECNQDKRGNAVCTTIIIITVDNYISSLSLALPLPLSSSDNDSHLDCRVPMKDVNEPLSLYPRGFAVDP
jgi:hypothetical protein